MKNLKALGLFVLAVLASLAAAVYAANWVAQRGSLDADKVVVAATDIPLGGKILPNMLNTVDWPRGSIPDGAFHDMQQLQDRVVKVGVLRGEAVLEGKLAPVGTKGGLAAVIAPGKRAMTVRVNDVVGVAGFALPGNYVDVVVNAQQEQAGRMEDSRQISKTVLENVLVLAVAQEADRDETKPKVVSAVTLELSPEDAEKFLCS
nr:Flp pilus assembly protein CpaB [Comamonas testosteroni]